MTANFNPLPKTTLDEERRTLRSPARPVDTRSEARKALEVGVRRTEGGLRGAFAQGAAALGFEDFARRQAQTAAEKMAVQPEDAPRISDIKDVESYADLDDYVTYGLMSSLPSMAVGAVAGGVAGALRGAGAAALTAGAASGVEQGGALFAEEMQRLPNRDPGEIAGATGVAGAAMGALDALPVMQAFNRLGAGRMGRRIVENALRSAGEEGATEGAQTLIERGTRRFLDENYDVFDEEGQNELLNAVAMGGIIGGGLGGASGVLPSSPFRDRVADFEAEDEVRRLRVNRAANALRELDPDAGPLVDGLVEADDIDGLEEFVVNRSKVFGFTPGDVVPNDKTLKDYGGAQVPSNDVMRGLAGSLLTRQGEAATAIPPENRPLPSPSGAFADVKRGRAKLTLDNFHKARAERARALTQRAFDREVGALESDRDAEIADLLSQTAEEDTVPAQVDDFAEDVGDEFIGDDTINLDAFEEDLSPEVSLGRRAYDAGYLVDENTGEVLDQVSPAERLVAGVRNDRGDLQPETRPLDEYLADQFNTRNDTRARTVGEAVQELSGPQTLDDFFAQEADRVLFNELGNQSKGRKAEFLKRARENMTPQEFLNLFDTVQQHGVPQQLRSDPESVILGGDESMVEFARMKKADLDRNWEKGKYKWATALTDVSKGTSRVIRMPTTLKRVYEQAFGGRDIEAASIPDIYRAFQRFQADQLSKGRGVAAPDDLIIAVQDGAPITLGKAREAAGKERLGRKEETARARLTEAVNEAARAYRDSGSESDFLALENARDALDEFDAARDEEITQDSGEFDKPAISAEAMDLPNPEFAAKEATRFRANYNALAKRAAKQAKDRALAEKLLDVAGRVYEAKSADEVAAILKAELSEGMQRELKTRMGTLKGGISPRAKVVDALDSMAESALRQGIEADADTILTLRRDDELDVNRSTVGLGGWNAGRQQAPKVRRIEQGEARLVDDLIRAFGIKRKVTFVTADELYGLKPSTVPAAVLKTIRAEFLGNTRGVAVRPNKRAELYVAVNPSLTNQRVRQAVLFHEMGHAVFKDFVYGNLTKDTLARAVSDEFAEWLKKTKGKTLGEVLKSKLPTDLFGEYSADPSVDMDVRLRSLPQQQIDYYLDFEEWFADNVSRWLQRRNPVPPEGAVARFFWRAAELLRSIWGVFQEQDAKPAGSVDTFLRGTVYRAHGVYAERWIETLSGHIPYPQDVVQAVDKTLLQPHAAEVLNTALLTRLVPFSDNAIRQTRRALSALLTAQERRVVGRVMNGWHVKQQILDYLQANAPQHLDRAMVDPDTTTAVGYQMWLLGTLNLGPDGKHLFTKLDAKLDDVFGLVSQHQQAETVLTALQSGLLTLRRHGKGYFVLRDRQARNTLLRRVGQSSLDAYKAIAPVVEGLLYPVQRRLLNTGVPELMKLAEMMAPIAGQRRSGEPYLIAKSRRLAELQGRYQRMTEKWDEATKRDVWEMLYDPERMKQAPDSEAKRAARNVKALFVSYYRYARGNLDLDFRQDYFPWVFNTNAIASDSAAFMHMLRLPKHRKNIESLAASWQMDPKDVPQAILDHLLDQKGNATLGSAPTDLKHSPFFGFSAVRSLNFLYTNGTQQERETLRSWMDQNLDHTVYMYTEQLVKRTEFARRFGKNGEQLADMLDAAKANGATTEDLRLADDFVAAMLGYHGRRTNAALHRLFGKEAPDRQVINPVLKNVMAGAMVMQNLAILGLATFTSLVDPLTVGVRAGDFRTAMKAYRAGVKEIAAKVKGKRTRAAELASAIGIIEERLVAESLSWQYSSTYLPHWMNAVNEGFFKLIMLNQWTQLTRTMATAGAEQFLLAHRKGKGDSKRYLEELGLKPGDVIKEKNQLKILTRPERAAATAEELARDDRVRAALFQFVDESIVRPSPNTRALWMSDPHFMLIGHLKGFMFAFHEQVLRRVWNEIGNKNFGPGAMLMSLVPAMMAANMLRAAFKDALPGEDSEEPDDPWLQAWWEAMQRAGLTGIFQVFLDAKRDVEYGSSPVASALGPTWDNTVSKIPEIMSGDEKAIVDQLPLQNLFGSVYEGALPIE